MRNTFTLIFILLSWFSVYAQQAERTAVAYDSVWHNLGPSVNSKYTEVRPVISPDGKTLFFARQFHPQNKGGARDDQDVWYATLQDASANTWSKAVNLGSPINNRAPNGVCAVTADGNSLLVINTYNADGSLEGDGVSISTRTANGWSLPVKVNIDNYYNNNPDNVDYFLSYSGKILLMAVERRDGLGDQDLFVSFLQASGNWSKPLNLGKQVNSRKADFAPFLAADEKTLYFASEGHKGYGKSDIFYTKRLDDTWQNWTVPVNMGRSVNTSDWDAYFTTTASGQQAYIVSSKNGTEGSRDIFRMDIKEKFKPEPVILVKGRVLDSETNLPLNAKIIYRSLVDGKEIGTARTNPVDGSYTIVLPGGKDYSFQVESVGYNTVDDKIIGTSTVAYNEKTKDIRLVAKEAKPIAKVEATPVANEEVKAVPKEEIKPLPAEEVKPVAIPEAIAVVKPLVKEVAKPVIKAEAKPKAEEVAKPLVKAVAKAPVKPRVKEEKPVVNEETKFTSKPKRQRVPVEDSRIRFNVNMILFEQSKYVLLDPSLEELERLTEILKENPNFEIAVQGHTDNQGDQKANYILSQNRVKVVRNYLIAQGISKKRIYTRGYGSTRPDFSNYIEETRRLNRRVEFVLLAKVGDKKQNQRYQVVSMETPKKLLTSQ
ncbi:OmpA family protein [Adhaeribacter aquaticus]|uniref:OmpA family protein n=1 Tax=Adhaeribacter aquaticus TaxID=299567 RepID=UPI0006863A8B|nr:OmpA family protein [Adhaeribacter aquaticus]